MKNVRFIASLLSLCALTAGCSSEYQEIKHKDVFKSACEESEGEYIKGRCVCDSYPCDEWVICNKQTKKCEQSEEPLLKECLVPDKEYCSNAHLYKCSEEKLWLEIVDTSKKCKNFGCLPDKSGCAECNDNVCAKGRIQYCVKGKLSLSENCKQNKCESSTKCENECENDERICRDSKLYTCENNSFKQTLCPYGCEINASGAPSRACSKTCTENDVICRDDKLQKCIAAEYVQFEECKDGNSCKNEKECGICKDKTTKCDNDENGIGWSSVCNNGEYSEKSKCRSKDDIVKDAIYSCKNKIDCGDCYDNDPVVCKNDLNDKGMLITCKNGQIVESICPNSNSCSKNECGECINGDKICRDVDGLGYIFTCQNGKYQQVSDCSYDKISLSCKNEKECGTCKNGTVICENELRDWYGIKTIEVGHVKECQNGKFEEIDKDKCIERSCNADNTDCGVCTNGARICDGLNIVECQNGAYKQVMQCQSSCGYDDKEAPVCDKK